MEQAFLTRRARVSGCMAEMIQWTQSVRALVVMSAQTARAFGAVASAFCRSGGIVGSSASVLSSNVTMSPSSALAASRNLRSTLSQWLFWPSGWSVARKGKPLMVAWTVVMPREGSFALASFGRIRKVQELALVVSAGRRSFAVKRIFEGVLVIFVWWCAVADKRL